MKQKWIEQIPIMKPITKERYSIKVRHEKDLLILDLFNYQKHDGRYCMNIQTGEHKIYKDGIWHTWSINNIWRTNQQNYYISKKDEQLISRLLDISEGYSFYYTIKGKEYSYNKEKQRRAYDNKVEKINELMKQVPMLPNEADQWIFERKGNRDYIFVNQKNAVCTACQKTVQAAGLKNNQILQCPECHKKVQVKTRSKKMEEKTQAMFLQKINHEMCVARHFDILLEWNQGGREVYWNEAVRIIIYKDKCQSHDLKSLKKGKKKYPEVYYNQDKKSNYIGFEEWWISNPANRRIQEEYLYPKGITEALEDTEFKKWIRTFETIAAAGQMMQYNNLMIDNCTDLANVAEYLIKGKFYRLLNDITNQKVVPINIHSQKIEEIFKIKDRQKINRIRDKNGGKYMLCWLQWADKENKKITDEVLSWLERETIRPSDIASISIQYMSIQQIMNYVIRQQQESYPQYDCQHVIGQWNDYLRMALILHKDIDDEMIYRPRELKRRHDEAVVEIQLRQEELQAEKYSERYPQAEAVLKMIRNKLEYIGENYLIRVPERIVDVIKEGRYLHHCVGATDRYFERIKNHETYICFMRKKTEPDTPFYTIEVEPGGTIRQHRGMYDEEPEFESVKPFLLEWQRVIKKRMTKQDHERATESKQKRLENIDDLKKKNNIRVLKGLEEDFMDADASV